jgi:two-component system cell cycle response regulator DivK
VNNTAVPGPLVLIVDDNERNRKLARDVLSAAGLETLEAGTGAEGIELARRQLPDVVLMDLRLPDMDGTDAARQLAAEPATSAIPVVAFTSLALEGGADWFESAGFAGYLGKPIDVETFPAQVLGYCRD